MDPVVEVAPVPDPPFIDVTPPKPPLEVAPSCRASSFLDLELGALGGSGES